MNQLNVGWGPTTWKGVLSTAIWGLLAVATFLTTLAGSLPQDKGLLLTTIAGALSGVSMAVTAAARVYFAKVKAGTLPWEEEVPVDEVPVEPTDSTVPVVEPTK